MKDHWLTFTTTITSPETFIDWNKNLTSYTKGNRTSMNTWCPPLVSNASYDLSSKPTIYTLEEVVSIHILVNHSANKTPDSPLLQFPLSCHPTISCPLRMPLHHPKMLSLDPPTIADDGDMNDQTAIPPFVHSTNATSAPGEDNNSLLSVIIMMLPLPMSHDSEVTPSPTISIPNKEPTVIHHIKSGILER